MNTNSSENVTVVAEEEKKPLPPSERAPKCPRCDSGNTKFCYYNNYSLSQPRYFCKSCRRYWTKGGTLRNVPIGGGCRKNKRPAKCSLDRIDLLLQSQVENNNNLLISSLSDQSLSTNGFSNFSSPWSYESSGSGESLSMAFARLQKQCNGHGHLELGFGFEPHSFIQAHPNFENPIMTSNLREKSATIGFLSSFSESQTTSSFNTQISLYNNGLIENGGDLNYGHTQLLLPYEDLSFDPMIGGSMKEDKCDNSILKEFPWRMEINNGHGSGPSSENDYINNNTNNLVIGSGSGSGSGSGHNSSAGSGFELVAGGRESWNNNNMPESASAPSWSNIINTSVLM